MVKLIFTSNKDVEEKETATKIPKDFVQIYERTESGRYIKRNFVRSYKR